ncbi:hypothetical protein KQI42_06315 [Tissierella sp. MSJ-40]|uniref:DUF2508 domain-containing protein n=1 Tax=Tissierella simiarum TaxID=2841534 RepID=A0ABS6E3X7_9FIRM|nr:hypothetical protein [Tissierella simiarum]MBU5437612.1 hypothetical protein [Tissierella simiarum]
MDLLKKIKQTEKELDTARCRFDYAESEKEIDFAIYLIAIAEENLKDLYKAVRRKGDIRA